MRAFILTLVLSVGLGILGVFSSPAAASGPQEKAKIRPVTKTVEGKLEKLDLQKGMLQVKKGPDEAVTVRLTAETKVVINGKPSTLNQLKRGDVVVVTYEIRQQEGNIAQMVVLNAPR
jgi:hypothetical protein